MHHVLQVDQLSETDMRGWLAFLHETPIASPIKGLKRTALPYATFVEVMAQEALAEYRKALRRRRLSQTQAA